MSTAQDETQDTSTPALSASASSFRPASSSSSADDLFHPSSASLWGAIGQSYSFGTAATAVGAGSSAVNVNHAPSSIARASSSASHTTAAGGGGNPNHQSVASSTASSSSLAQAAAAGRGGASEAQLSLWNFGGFDVDALTNSGDPHGGNAGAGLRGQFQGRNNQGGAPRPSSASAAEAPSFYDPSSATAGGGLMLDDNNVNLGFMHDHRAPASDVSGLSSAFGNVNLNRFVPPSAHGGGGGGGVNGTGGGGRYNDSHNRNDRDEGQSFRPPGNAHNASSRGYPSGPPPMSYHPPGWDTIPRWTQAQGGQISYGSNAGVGGGVGAGGGMYSTSLGTADDVGGGGYVGARGNAASRHNVPPYPAPAMNDYGMSGGGPGTGGGQYGGAYQGYVDPAQGHGNYRQIPSFVPPPPPHQYGMGGGVGHAGHAEVPAGPYPPSFPTPNASGRNNPSSLYSAANNGGYSEDGGLESTATGGALASLLQTPFNPSAHAQQRKYPPILGGAPVGTSNHDQGYGNVAGTTGAPYEHRKTAAASATASTLSSSASSASMRGMDPPGNNNYSSVPNQRGGVDRSSTTPVTSLTAASSSRLGAGEISPTPSNISSGAASNAENQNQNSKPILPKRTIVPESNSPAPSEDDEGRNYNGIPVPAPHDSQAKKREWLLTMNATLEDTPTGQLDPNILPLSTIMNGWAKQKSSEGARMVEYWLDRVHSEYNSENLHGVHPTARMYTMAVDAWAKSGGGAPAARRAEALLERMDRLYREGGGRHEALKPTTGIFNAVINAWARSREKIAPARAEQILAWMEKLREQGGEDLDISPDKYTFNTVIHAYAKSGAKEAATKAHRILDNMIQMYREGNSSVKPDTITYNVVINAYAKSGNKGAAQQAENLLQSMHMMYDQGDLSVKPNVVTYGAVIDAFAKSMDRNAAGRADALLANMVQLHQSDPVRHADLRPNTYVFNTVINAWAKSKERGAAAKAEEMLVAMDRLHASGFPGLKPDAFTYTAVIDAYAKSGYRGAASRADLLLDQMEAKYAAGDADLKPNTFTYNAVINALAKSGEPGAAARAERVLHNMVNRLRANGGNDVKPTTINFNTVLDAWAKSGEGEAAAERAEAILEWMDRLNKAGNTDVKPDTITFNAVIDAWARSGCKRGPQRAEQILNHMDELYHGGNMDVKPDTYTYNTLINALAKSGDGGAAARAEEILAIMETRFQAGDKSFKPNTRSHTSVIDAWAKSGEPGAATRAEQILENLKSLYDNTGDPEIKPNVYTANAVMNACAFTKHEVDRIDALGMAFRTFEWLDSQKDIKPDAYTFTIMLSVCANLIPKEESGLRFEHAKMLFQKCCDSGHVNDHVLWKLKLTVNEMEYHKLVGFGVETKAADLPASWSRLVATNNKKSAGDNRNNWSRRGKKHSM